MKITIRHLIVICLFHSALVHGVDGSTDEHLRLSMKKFFPDVEITSVKPTPMGDIYQVAAGNEYIYISKDGRYVIQGDLIDMEQKWNLTEQERTLWRQQQFTTLEGNALITFKSKTERHVIYVFTDIDCGYCRKLHEEVHKINENGITVHYLAYPAQGEFTKNWAQMSEVWCSKDRNEALTRAKLGQRDNLAAGKTTDEILACSEMIKKQFELANEFDVIGTPALYLDNGAAIEGYMPANKLTSKIEEMKKLSANISYKM